MSAIAYASKQDMIKQEILSLADENGVVTARAVFDRARSENSILHGEFVWDGDKAVEALGLQRAAELIRTVKIKVVVDSRKIIAPYYVNHPSDGKSGEYVPLASVRSDDTVKHGVLISEISRIESAIKRAAAIAGVLEIEREFEKMMESIDAVRKIIAKP